MNQKGFNSIVAVLVFAVVVGGLAVGMSYYFKKDTTTNSNANSVTNTVTNTVANINTTINTNTTASETKTFTITELGVQMQIPQDLNLVYAIDSNSAYFSTNELVDRGCLTTGATRGSIGVISRYDTAMTTGGLTDPKIIGGKYFYFVSPHATCSPTANTETDALQTATLQQLQVAFQTLEAIDQTATSNVFDFSNAKVGDKVAGMTITEIGKYNPDLANSDPNRNRKVVFSGQATITAQVTHDYSEFDGSWHVRVTNVTEASQLKLPVMSDSINAVAFWLSNYDFAAAVFPKNYSGQATFTISGYSLVEYPSEVVNTATFVSKQ